jgi:hypothetical protein
MENCFMNDPSEHNEHADQLDAANNQDEAKRAERRKALTRMGIFAAFTAPVLLGMMTSAKAQPLSPT